MGHAWQNIVEPKSIASNGLGNPLQMGELSIALIDYRRVNPSAPRGEVIPDMASMSDLWVHGENQRTEVPTKAATGSQIKVGSKRNVCVYMRRGIVQCEFVYRLCLSGPYFKNWLCQLAFCEIQVLQLSSNNSPNLTCKTNQSSPGNPTTSHSFHRACTFIYLLKDSCLI